MNKLIKSTTVICLMFLTAVGLAKDKEPTLVFETKKEVKTMIFELNSPDKEASIKFVDVKGNVLFLEDIAENAGYIKKFNLKDLPEGTYELTTENKLRAIVYTIAVESGNARMISKRTIAKPVFRFNMDNKVYLNVPANGNKKVTVSIYNEAGKLVQEKRFKNTTDSVKVFNFSDSEKGKYTIRVWNSNGMYLESHEVK